MSQIFGRYNVECSAEFSEFRESVVPTQAMEEHKNMHPPQFLEQSELYHGMEIGGKSSTDHQTMDQSHEVSLASNSLEERLKNMKLFSPACCIYRVPERSRKLHRKAYTPRVVSIGPLHHGKENLKAMEDHKIMYLQQFLQQSKVSREGLCNVIKDNEKDLRDCYAETTGLNNAEFVTMILLDAVFIIMVLLKLKDRSFVFRNGLSDRIFYRPLMLPNVVFDMLLLENQLPFFILEKLFELSSVAENYTIIELTCGFLRSQWAGWVKEDSWKAIDFSGVLHFVDFLRKCQQPRALCRRPAEETAFSRAHFSGVLHFVDFLRKCLQPLALCRRAVEETAFSRAPTATELHQSGVKFRNPEKSSLFDVRFSKGILEIPQLQIDEGTEILFRNLLAFEECHNWIEDTFIDDYITFISCLVRAPNDVEILARKWNSKNMLNSDKVVSNLLYSHDHDNIVVTRNSFLWGVCKALNSHCRTRRHNKLMTLKAALKQMFVNNP